jgi:PAS domain S-box-containing protein
MGTSNETEAYFVFALGLLLSLNSGYINGLCLSGLLTEGGSARQGVSAFTGTYTKSGLALAGGDPKLFGFEFTLILSFIGGATVAGLLNPKAIPHKLTPSYGPTFLLGSLCMIAAALAAALHPDGRALYYFAAMANGIQNGMTSTYSANLIRTTHLTGTSTDIGLIMGQMMRGNWKNLWKFKVLCGLATSFWLGGLISFYSASAFLSNSLWFSAGLFLSIGLTHLIFVVVTQKVSFVQAMLGNWKWDKVLQQMASSVNKGSGSTALSDLTPEQVDQVFDEIDDDQSGEIDAEELYHALNKMGIKITMKCVGQMISVVDENDDGVIDREEFRTLVKMATLRAEHKRETKIRKRETLNKFKSSIIRRSTNGYDDDDFVEDISEVNYEEKKVQDYSPGMPRTYQEALPPDGKGDGRAIVVTEAKHPFAVVGVNEPWEDLCGYKSSEACGKSMSSMIQGPKTNREGIKQAMDQLSKGAEHVDCTTVNYRKDGSMFNNFLTMGPLYDDGGIDEEDGGRKPAFYVGILMNIGELAQDMSALDEEEGNETAA